MKTHRNYNASVVGIINTYMDATSTAATD